MQRDVAINLTNEWRALSTPPPADDASDRLGRALWTYVPDDVEAGGTALVDDVPTVLALTPSAVYLACLDVADEPSTRVRLRRLPLKGYDLRITVVDDRAGKLPNGSVGAHMREWTFQWESGEAIRFQSIVKVFDAFSDEPGSAEEFAQALAAACDWVLPGPAGRRA